jgi:DNA-binding NarL/FixJ family response regulator
MHKGTVHIVVADAQFLARAGLKYLFADHPLIKVVGEATDLEELEAVVTAQHPQIVMLDYNNSDVFQIDDIAKLHAQHPGLRVLVVTDDHDKAHIHQVLHNGVNCILTKNCSPEEIVSAVLATAKGERFFCDKVLQLILEKPEAPKDAEDCFPTRLSTREIEIVRLVAQGIQTKDIAERLCLSMHTVYTHRKNILKKLQINSVSEMIVYALNSGLMTAQEK